MCFLNFRVMSAFIAIAIKTLKCDASTSEQLMDHLDLPDFVKQNIDKNIIPYLKAVEIDGYESYKMRKMMIVGNAGM